MINIFGVPVALPAALTFGCAALAVACLWLRGPWWWIVGVFSLGLGIAFGYLMPIALIWVGLFAVICGVYARHSDSQRLGWVSGLSGIALILTAVLLGLRALPGFSGYPVVQDAVLSPGAMPFTMYWGFEKISVGVLILGLIVRPSAKQDLTFLTGIKYALPLMLGNIAVLATVAGTVSYVNFDPKWPSILGAWFLSNLMFTCMSEEAFFRGLIQGELLQRIASEKLRVWAPVLVAGVTFGLAHFAGGMAYVILASIAGIGYGLTYALTRRIEWAIVAHVVLNTTHLLLFSYPRLVA
jgi:membrane protease YdiL (CAAX protease family)